MSIIKGRQSKSLFESQKATSSHNYYQSVYGLRGKKLAIELLNHTLKIETYSKQRKKENMKDKKEKKGRKRN